MAGSLTQDDVITVTHQSCLLLDAMTLTQVVFAQGSNEVEEDEDKERPLPLLPVLKALHAAWLAASPKTVTHWAAPMQEALKQSLQPGRYNDFFCIDCFGRQANVLASICPYRGTTAARTQ